MDRWAVVVGKPVLRRVQVRHRVLVLHKEKLRGEGMRLGEHHKAQVGVHGLVEGSVEAGLHRE